MCGNLSTPVLLSVFSAVLSDRGAAFVNLITELLILEILALANRHASALCSICSKVEVTG